MRVVRLRGIYKITLIFFVITICTSCLFFLYTHEYESDNKSRKIALMEHNIRSAVNKDKCRLPDLPIDNPEIKRHYHDVKEIICGKATDDWVICKGSYCHIKEELINKLESPKCSFIDLIRSSDEHVRYGLPKKKTDHVLLSDSDFVKAVCQTTDGHSYFGMAAGVRNSVKPTQGRKQPNKTYFNVLILGFDSLSRNHYIRKLPKTYNYLVKELNAIVLKGYNIVGDGTPQALIPLLTGFTELELPETRKRIRNSQKVNIYPFLWTDYAKAGYVTSFNEDIPRVGTFNYRLKGFDHQPVDHYLRTFYVEAENILSNSAPNCIGHTPDHIIMLNYTKMIMKHYPNDPRFIFSFHGGLSHDDINLIGAADKDVLNFLQQLRRDDLLNHTILILMADHGSRFSAMRASLQGKQEERLPFFSFVLPETFSKRFPRQYDNFMKNVDRLVTPFDVHATLKDLLVLQDLYVQEEEQSTPAPISNLAKSRAISLFDKIPDNRSCYDAYIEPHWCACLNWKKLDLADKNNYGILLKASSAIVNTINDATKDWRDECVHLELLRINWVMRLQPKLDLLHFKGTNDRDGYEPDMSGSVPTDEEFYQLQIIVEPGNSLFEATVAYNLIYMSMHLKISEISRINKYGAQAHCILDKNPDLRKFCYCRTPKA